MENVIVLRSLNDIDSNGKRYLSKKVATTLKCTCTLAYIVIEPKCYYILFKQLKIYNKETFYWIKDELFRKVLVHDYQIAINYGLQNFFKKHDLNQSFMWDTHGTEFDILQEQCHGDHSGASFACSLRNLEQIFKYGFYYYYFNSKE